MSEVKKTDGQAGGKRKKSYYAPKSHKKGRYALAAGQKGFLITVNNREREAVGEAYRLLNEYADLLYGPQPKKDAASVEKEVSDIDDEDDMEQALSKEVSQLKDTNVAERRFHVATSGAKNCIFVQTTLPRPDEIVTRIFTDLFETRLAKTRFIIRLLPVVATCRADVDTICALAEEILPTYFSEPGRTFSLEIKVRNNSGLSRTALLPKLGAVIEDLNVDARVDLTSPELVICVDILKTVCCIGVVADFKRFRRYNIHELCKDGTISTVGDTSMNTKNTEVIINDASNENKQVDDDNVDPPDGKAVSGDSKDTVNDAEITESIVNDTNGKHKVFSTGTKVTCDEQFENTVSIATSDGKDTGNSIGCVEDVVCVDSTDISDDKVESNKTEKSCDGQI